MEYDLNIVKLAHNMALKSKSKFRLGAVIAHRKKVISTGYNQMNKTHPITRRFNYNSWAPGIHAEIHAAIGISAKDLEGSSIYVYRINKHGEQALAKPCEMCEKFLKSVGIRKAIYTTNNSIDIINYD